MSAFDAERVQQRGRVRRHVGQRVGHVGLAARARRLQRGARVGQDTVPFLGKADVAIVEADDAQTGRFQPLVEFVRPGGQLAAEAVDEEEWNAIGRSGGLVFDLDAVGANLGHAFLPPISGKLSGEAFLDKWRGGPEFARPCAAPSTDSPMRHSTF